MVWFDRLVVIGHSRLYMFFLYIFEFPLMDLDIPFEPQSVHTSVFLLGQTWTLLGAPTFASDTPKALEGKRVSGGPICSKVTQPSQEAHHRMIPETDSHCTFPFQQALCLPGCTPLTSNDQQSLLTFGCWHS